MDSSYRSVSPASAQCRMLPDEDRRTLAHDTDDEFSPEYLAVLVVCGGTVRESDWAQLPEAVAARRPAPGRAPVVHGQGD